MCGILLLLIHAVLIRSESRIGPARRLIDEYVSAHRIPTHEMVALVRESPCDRRFISADFWGRGLGNSVNTPLNAMALAVITNRTLLLSADKQYQAGFWRYLGDVPWAEKQQVMNAFRQAGGCARCGCTEEEVVRNFFPMNPRCLAQNTCGNGIEWLLCDQALVSTSSPQLEHVRGAVTWLVGSMLAARFSYLDQDIYMKERFFVLFPSLPKEGILNTWGLLYDALITRQPIYRSQGYENRLPPLAPVIQRKLSDLSHSLYDIAVHIRHRQFQPIEFVEDHAVACVLHAFQHHSPPKGATMYLATELPSRIPVFIDAIKKATGRNDFRFDFLNVSAVPEREALSRIARTNARAVRRDWGEHALERWLSVADFYLASSAKLLIGTLSSTFSELAAASVYPRTTTYLYDPIFHITGPERAQPQNRKWPADNEYFSDYGPHFSCIRADTHWPAPQYIRLRPAAARAWLRKHRCSGIHRHSSRRLAWNVSFS